MRRRRLALIVEGNEETNFMRIVNSYANLVDDVEIEVMNAHGFGNIPSIFDACYRDLTYDEVLALVDVDGWKTDCYEQVTSKIKRIIGRFPVDQVLFNNPNSLQLLLLPFVDEVMEFSDKAHYSYLVHEAFPKVKGVYRASKSQLKVIHDSYDREAYLLLLSKSEAYSDDPDDLPSSSFAPFLRGLEKK